MRQQFREDTAGTIEFYPPENSVPSTATLDLYDNSHTTLASAATATIDSTSTTIAANVAEGARSLTVALATGITAGVSYLVQEAGQKWICRVKSVSTTTVYFYGECPFALTTSATFKGYRLSYALTTTHTANKGENFSAEFHYTADSVVRHHIQTFDVVASIAWYPTTINNLVDAHPHLQRWLDSDDKDASNLLDTAWKQRLVPMLFAKQMRIERIRDLDQLIPLHTAIANEMVAFDQFMADPDKAVQHQAASKLTDDTSQLLFANLSWYDANDDKVPSADEQNVVRVVWAYR
jgi:hypothetical protein